MPINILIADDHSVVRQGLKMFLALDSDLEIVGEASNGREAVDLVAKLEPDVVLMDLLMPVMDGIEATEIIRRDFPETEVIALTSILEDALILRAIRAGAIGYLLKDTQADELNRAIKSAAAGQVQLSPQAANRLLRGLSEPEPKEMLSDREIEVLQLIALGKSNKQIGKELVISETTVKTHVSNILMKLNLSSRTQAALYAVRLGLVTLD